MGILRQLTHFSGADTPSGNIGLHLSRDWSTEALSMLLLDSVLHLRIKREIWKL